MKASKICSVAVVLAAVAMAPPAVAQSGTAVVDARMSTYLAGGNTYSTPPLGGGGLSPLEILLNPGTGRVLTFNSITGTATFCGVSCAAGPDGYASSPGTQLSGSGAIGGLAVPGRVAFWTGVFTGPMQPPSQAASAYTDLDFLSLSGMLLGQQFFIGDGRTSGNVIQQFLIPDNATALYLGFADGFAFAGDPGYYNDNVGTFSAQYSISSASTTVPEPSTFALAGIGISALLFMQRRRVTKQ
ncbi:MAG: PEP-CTERM sorting domain-containing protein [Gemmatimonadaceae bacterium]|nr:PEP-CTERM sorting domain-containing protein [Gemmatimonadaceae bacterium]